MAEFEFADIRARQLANYEEIIAEFDHESIEGEVENEDGEKVTVTMPAQSFAYWLDHVHAAIDAKWFKHLTKDQADDFTSRELFTVFRQIDDKHTELLAASFIDPN